jgi:hypothetical protein
VHCETNVSTPLYVQHGSSLCLVRPGLVPSCSYTPPPPPPAGRRCVVWRRLWAKRLPGYDDVIFVLSARTSLNAALVAPITGVYTRVASYYDWIQRGMTRFNNQTLLDEIEAQKAQQQAQQQEQQQEDGDMLPIVNPSMPDCMPCPYPSSCSSASESRAAERHRLHCPSRVGGNCLAVAETDETLFLPT